MPHRRSPIRPPGTVAITLLIVLVVMQLVVVGIVIAGARDHDLTDNRVDTVRAFYAAEAGMNMAIREILTYNDDDGDGGIGSISNDGNSANDPALGTARFVITSAPVGNETALTCTGRSGSCRHVFTCSGEAGARFSPNRRVIYCSWPNNIPQYRTWNGATWGAAANTTTFSAKQYWAVFKGCPTRNETIAAASIHGGNLEASVQTNSTWAAATAMTAAIGTLAERPFYFGYEQVSGDGLIVYRSGNSATIYYRTWAGAAWSAQQSTASLLTGNPTFMKLVPKSGSDEIMLYVLDDNNDIEAMVWNGSAFGNKVTLETNASASTDECVDACYEPLSGRCMVVWGRSGSNQPQYRIWDGSGWLAAAAAPTVGAVPLWLHLAGNPGANNLMLGTLDASSHVNVNIWSGSVWGTDLQVETSASATGTRAFDVAYQANGTAAVIIWGASGQTSARYRVYNGSTWGAQQTAPALSAIPLLIQLSAAMTGSKMTALCGMSGGQSGLDSIYWNGSTFASSMHLEDNVSGPAPREVFMLPNEPAGNTPGTARLWTEVAP